MPFFPESYLPQLAVGSLLLAAATPAQAQRPEYRPGYVVLATAPTDTLRGEIDLTRAGRAQALIRFQTTSTSASRDYAASELLAAGHAGGQQWRRGVVPQGAISRSAWLEVLVAGSASLYRDPTGKLPATYYLDKPGRTPMPLKREQFVQVLQTSFADCPTVNTQVAEAGKYIYDVAYLRRYVINYNRCVSPRAPVVVTPEQSARAKNGPLRWTVQAGVTQVQLFHPYVTRRRAVSGPLTPTLGAGIWLPFSQHWGLVAGATLVGLRSDNTISQPVPNSDNTQTMRYRTKGGLLRLPLSLRYVLLSPEATWRPYVQVGGHFSQIIRGRLHWDSAYSGPGPNVPASLSYPIYYDGIGRGIQAETGVLLRYGHHYLGAGLRYEQTYGFHNSNRHFVLDYNQLSFALTYLH